jgi:AcrR family transcriptional regulator
MAKKSRVEPMVRRTSYHHGDLVQTLLTAAIDLIEERGVENLSLREVSKRAGVSPGAPFRHFSSKSALLTAVAEQAMDRLYKAVSLARENARSAEPSAIFEAIGLAYLEWALANPTHFQIISSRSLIDFDGSAGLLRQNAAIRKEMSDLLAEAAKQGQLASDFDLDQLILASRAFTYGLARMVVDGHLPGWHPTETPTIAVQRALRLFIDRVFNRSRNDTN